MAELQTSPSPPQPQAQDNTTHLRKKRKKSRYLKQGYHKSERDDHRRVTARAFLSGITRDSHLLAGQPSRGQAPAPEEGDSASSLISTAPQRKRSVVAASAAPSPPSTPVLDAQYSPTFKKFAERCLEQHNQVPLGTSKSMDHVVESLAHQQLSGIRTSHSVDYAEPPVPVSSSDHRDALLHIVTKWSSTAEGAIYENQLPTKRYYETGRSSRVVLCTTPTRAIVSVLSILPYKKSMRHDNPRERMRTRANSFSLQMDLDGLQLGTTTEEVSLAFLLNSVWISPEIPQSTSDPSTPSLIRKGSVRKSAEVNIVDKRSSTPTPHTRYHIVNPEVFSADSAGTVWNTDSRTSLSVVLNYHPRFLDNEELFASRKTTTLTPPGYRVSIIEYAKKSDIKKAVNDRFKELYPQVEISLTKLIKIKRKMHEIAIECNLDLAAVSYAYVYLEKLVLMGKIHKSVRRPVAGVCLLLAAKFVVDHRKREISLLIEEITDSFRLSSRELILYEFPVLAILQFSLLAPNFQAMPHYDRLIQATTH